MRRSGAAVLGAIVAALLAPPAADAAGPRLVFQCGKALHLCRVDADGRNAARLTTSKAPRFPAYTPRASGITYVERRGSDHHLWRADSALRNRRRIDRAGPFGDDSVLSTDARRVAHFAIAAWSTHAIPATPESVNCCFFAPDSHAVYPGGDELYTVWHAGEGSTAGVCAIPLLLDNSDRRCGRRIADTAAAAPAKFDVSVDASRVVTATDTGGHRSLAVYDAATGRRIRTLTRGHVDDIPVISPDGRWVAFLRDPVGVLDSTENAGKIGVVPITGDRVRIVARSGGRPAWVGR